MTGQAQALCFSVALRSDLLGSWAPIHKISKRIQPGLLNATIVVVLLLTISCVQSCGWAAISTTSMLAVGLIAALFCWYYLRRIVHKPSLHYNKEMAWLRLLVENCESLHQRYWPTPWCLNAHLQVLLLLLRDVNPSAKRPTRRQLLTHKDGGVTALDWTLNFKDLPSNAPIVLWFHSIMGDKIPPEFVDEFQARGWRSCCHVRRGHGGLLLKTPKWNTMGDTDDVVDAVREIETAYPDVPLLLVGLSAGSGLVARYLGREGSKVPFRAAALLSPGTSLKKAWKNVHWIYERVLLQRMKDFFLKPHEMVLRRGELEEHYQNAINSERLFDFHEKAAPLCGFNSVEEYYDTSCPLAKAHDMQIPFLMAVSKDDPICHEGSIDYDDVKRTGHGIVATVDFGSHCTFYEGWSAQSWLPKLTVDFLETAMQHPCTANVGAASNPALVS